MVAFRESHTNDILTVWGPEIYQEEQKETNEKEDLVIIDKSTRDVSNRAVDKETGIIESFRERSTSQIHEEGHEDENH